MMRRFVILVDSDATKEERDAVTEHLRNSGTYGFWHYFPFSWLVTTRVESVTSVTLRDEIQEKLGGTSIVVIQTDSGTTWGAYGPKVESEWLLETWTKD